MGDKKIRVLVVEDHPVVRAGIRSALASCELLSVVGEASTGEEAVTMARKLLPGVMVMDIELPGMDGIEVAELLRGEVPKVKIILLTIHGDAGHLQRAAASGVCGYLLKNAPVQKLVASVLAAGSGEVPAGVAGPAPLTERDERVLALVAKGKSNKEIASEMGVEVRTAGSYRETVRRKLNIRTTAGLTRYAVARGLIGKERAGEDMG